MARRAPRAALSRHGLRRGPVSREVVETPGVVRGGCAGRDRSRRGAADAARRLLDGRRRRGAKRRRAGCRGGARPCPWLPDRLDLSRLRGRRLDVLHGKLDRALPGSPASAPKARTVGSSAHEASASRGATTSYRAPSTASPCACAAAFCLCRAPAAGRRSPRSGSRSGRRRERAGRDRPRRHEPDQPSGHARRRRHPAARRRPRRGSAVGHRVPLGRRRRAGRLLRRLRVRHDDRLSPVLHAQGLRGACARQGDARDPRLHDDAGPSHPMGDRPSQAPRAVGQAGRPALPACRPRRRRVGCGEGLRARARGLDVLESRHGAGTGVRP